ncbi:Sugar kinase of the NBD/HSP70 family, may contain an N-terminal HTH domain [Friedmanniella luteola]|uniref:Sugar kinase of the NBD/HSP70 family, may contain an N-terminal HTH domain n=1 Tax=Friedmanniella luteola TaxID=546871 RepID=A0A1H1LMZ3_9ACTN|nr:ROK family protein [Friedmanniella luteola]SDR75249.1 Sugar kinase of the NBD/HSP70 family, may contain an N-terminal HTH domain [Friedmanniella luteola]
MRRTHPVHAVRRSGGSGDLRQGNLAQILRFVRDHGPSSRHDIAHGCGLGISTMTDLVGELRSRGLVRELEPVRRPGAGRPTKPIALDGDTWCVLGVQLDMLEASFICTTVGGRELWREQVPLQLLHSGPERGFALFHTALCGQLRRIPEDKSLVTVHIGLPGYVGEDGGTVSWCPTLDWDGLPLKTAVYDTLYSAGWEDVTVGIDHDGHLAALQAVRAELPAPMPHVAVYVGGLREINGGVVLGGEIFRGYGGGAGDLGHVRVHPDGPACACGRRGCLESLLGPEQLLARSELVSASEATRLTTFEPFRALQMLVEAARTDHPGVLAALEQGGAALGVALDGIIGTINPQVVVLGGYLGLLRRSLQDALQEGIDARIAIGPFAATQVVSLDSVGVNRVVLGAAVAARDAVLQDPLNLTQVL